MFDPKSNDFKLFIGKKCFFKEKAIFLGIKHSTSVLVQTEKNNVFLLDFESNFCIVKLLSKKTLKMTISTSIWGAQNPNAGRNIQHTPLKRIKELKIEKLEILLWKTRLVPLAAGLPVLGRVLKIRTPYPITRIQGLT